MNEIVGSKVYENIKPDERVTPDLDHCLYCKVSQSGTTKDNKGWHKDIDYKIPLDCINGAAIKQCPACKTIYILKGPMEGNSNESSSK